MDARGGEAWGIGLPADCVVVRASGEDAYAVIGVAERLGAGNVHADVISLNEIVGGVLEEDAATAIAGDHVARGRGRAADETVGSEQAYTCGISYGFRAGDIGTDEVTLDDETRATEREAVTVAAGDDVASGNGCYANRDRIHAVVINAGSNAQSGSPRLFRTDKVTLNYPDD